MLESRFTKGLIRSRAALTYAEAQSRIDDPNDKSDIAASLRLMNDLAKNLRRRRFQAGALEARRGAAAVLHARTRAHTPTHAHARTR